ncbi:MAG: HPr family phosphocarrier protein [Lachnospiraceae bacterium]|nr:HPr family phosphocarrier protein [Lachnospiraceae bacterium]
MVSQSVMPRSNAGNIDVPELVQMACRYRSDISIRNGQGEFDVKSIMAMMALNFMDSVLTLSASGEDEEMAVRELVCYLNGKTE